MLNCGECGREFKKGDSIFVCKSCRDIFCEDCIEEHIKNCIKESAYEHTAICSVCGSEVSELFDCPVCSEGDMCEDCLEEHIENEHSQDYDEYDYDDFVDKEIVETL